MGFGLHRILEGHSQAHGDPFTWNVIITQTYYEHYIPNYKTSLFLNKPMFYCLVTHKIYSLSFSLSFLCILWRGLFLGDLSSYTLSFIFMHFGLCMCFSSSFYVIFLNFPTSRFVFLHLLSFSDLLRFPFGICFFQLDPCHAWCFNIPSIPSLLKRKYLSISSFRIC